MLICRYGKRHFDDSSKSSRIRDPCLCAGRPVLCIVSEEDEGFHSQSVGNPLDVVEGNIALAPLDPRKIGSIHIDLEGKILLAQPPLFPVPSDIRTNDRA